MIMSRKILQKQHSDYNFRKLFKPSYLTALIGFTLCVGINSPAFALKGSLAIQKGKQLPNVSMIGSNGKAVNLNTLKGEVTLISIVPQLNTPVCDEQTHRFSENNDGLDQHIALVTMSTNTSEDQVTFAQKAKIQNMTFLSDAPEFQFGRKTGLLKKSIAILQRAVIVLDEESIIRYVEIVPMSQLPNFDQAYRVVRSLISTHPKESSYD